MLLIFDKVRDRISTGLVTLSEKMVHNPNNGYRGKINDIISISPFQKVAVACAALGRMVGLSRVDCFYDCQYNLKEIKQATETDSILRVVVKKYTELFMKSGYTFKGANDEAVRYLESRIRLMSFMSNNSFELLMRETAYDLVRFSNAFWVKSRVDHIPAVKAKGIVKSGKAVGGYFRVDPDTMYIQFNDKGEIKGYKQVVEGNREKKFAKEDVIHFTFDRDPGSVWGVPRWIAALEDIRAVRKTESLALTMASRYAIPMLHAKVGLDHDGMGGTKKEVDDVCRVIEKTPTDGVLATTERVKLEAIGIQGSAMDLSPTLNYLENREFSGLEVSASMMGRGGSKQDADSMEEQVHNAVKDMQATFSIQFKHHVIPELLLEGGFNPILNDEDIVDLEFNEINLDTKVKKENHIINLFQSNAITFSEMRSMLGFKNDDVDMSQLYSNLIEQANTLEQIDANAANAMELAQFNQEGAEKLARLNAQLSPTPTSTSSSTSSADKSKGKSYAKKNTGNGKTKKSGKQNGTVKATDSPSNQHGTYSAKIKESELTTTLGDELKEDGSNISNVKDKLTLVAQGMMREGALAGRLHALDSIEPTVKHKKPKIAQESETISNFINSNLTQFFMDIKKPSSNIGAERRLKEAYSKQKYRLDYMMDFVYRKSYWYAFCKECAANGISEVQVQTKDDSKHSEDHRFKWINTSDFSLSEIPGYSTGCQCTLAILK